FRECRGEGLPGIPRVELLAYMAEAAEALDFMYSAYQLQHLDIKPQNLFLVHNHIKVADFGLVKDLQGGMASVTGGVTPVYAAPETFDGKVTEFSDQYSLAIVYQELLTGQRPFNGTSLRQLVMQHIYSEPDLTSLPGTDCPVVARALAKDPGQRYPLCSDFVCALRAAAQPPPVQISAPPPEPSRKEPERGGATDELDEEPTHAGPKHREAGGDLSRRREPSLLPLDGEADDLPVPTTPSPARNQPTPRPDSRTPPAAAPARKATVDATLANGKADGILMPALVIGLGRLGLGVLRQLRRQVADELDGPDALPNVRLLYIDADPETTRAAGSGRAEMALRPSEILLARLHRPSYYLKPQGGPLAVESWLPSRILYRMPRQQTPNGIRALGRLALVDNHRTISRRLEVELRDCCRPEALQQAVRQTGLAVRSNMPRVYVVAGLAGGTGSGMFLDLAYTVRELLRTLGHDGAEVIGLFLLPQANEDCLRPSDLANTFAALTELNHFGSRTARFEARYEPNEPGGPTRRLREVGAPFERCALFALPDARGPAIEDGEASLRLTHATARALAQVGRHLFSELATPLGRAADHLRRQAGATQVPFYHAPGMYRILWPRRQLLEQSARAVCRRLVQRWMSKDAKPLREPLKPWVRQQWDEQGLSQEQLIARFQQAGEKALKQAPESVFAATSAAVQEALPQTGKSVEKPFKPALVFDAMERLEELLGVPEEFRKAGGPANQPGVLEQALLDTSADLCEEYGQKLAVLVVRLIEDPQYRLAGAEEIIRQLNALVEQALKHHEELAQELQQRSVAAFERIHRLLEGQPTVTQTTPIWKAPFTRRSPAPGVGTAAELLELLRAYPKCRYQSLILQRVSALYVSLRGQLSDQLREVDFCRARLGELVGMLTPDPEEAARGGPAAGRHLLPEGCQNLADAVKRTDEGVTAEHLLEFDRRVQALLRNQFRALVHVCTTSANVLRTLAPALRQEARAFLESRLEVADVAESYLLQQQEREQPDGSATDALRQDLLAAYQKAAPELHVRGTPAEAVLLAVPVSSAGQEFRGLAREALALPAVGEAAATDEIVFYREYQNISLANVDQISEAARQAYLKMLAQENLTPHSRTDVAEWRTAEGDTVIRAPADRVTR
ncbi:MAG TPA: tubulin-like doman-containing protein, partial [Gemmataceae bacterium]|nr:tubulin-like doman-containing protein [Gemmataceae bacterium]